MTAPLMLSGVRAFVVDDNDTNRLILREMLSNRGAVVDEAEDGPAALEQFEHARTRGIPHTLMILDCRMPGMDSFQVAERLKAREAQGLTVLMLSSDDLKVEIARAHELVLDAYLIKPVRRSELFEAIRTAMTNQAPAPDAGIKKPEQTSALPSINGPIPETQATLHILLADDSPDNRVLIHAYLKDTGYLLDDAENGAIAVAKIKAGNYDLLLMDVQMPVMDGLEATRTIREWEREEGLPRMPIFALTASAVEDDVKRAPDAGVDMHISKPIKRALLLAAIKKSGRLTDPVVRTADDAAA